MRGYVNLIALLLASSNPLLAEALKIESFHDQEHAFVTTPDGSTVSVGELELEFPLDITGMERGQYLFNGPEGEGYRVYVPEVVITGSTERVVLCDQSQVVFADDYRIASARGVEGECE